LDCHVALTPCLPQQALNDELILFYHIWMALYSELPIFKKSYDLLLYVFQLTKLFPKEYKYTLGEKMKTELLDMIVSVFHANKTQNKVLFLDQVQTHIETIRIVLRISHDLKIIPTKKFAHASLLLESVSKQTVGWKRSTQQ
jgi:hypothetical protein